MITLNPAKIESLVKICKFYQKGIGKNEQSNEGNILDAIFIEFQGISSMKLSETDMETLRQEVPVEILIK